MFDNIHFFREDITHITPHSRIMDDLDEYADDPSRITAYNSILVNADFLVSGYTSILFPPVFTGNGPRPVLAPQGFYLCDHWKNYYTKRENYESYMVSYTLGGSGKLEYEGKTYELKEKDIFFIDCRKYQYYYTIGDKWNHVDIHFNGEYAGEIFREYYSQNDSPVCSDSKLGTIIRLIEELASVWDTAAIYPELYISDQLTQLCTGLLLMKKKVLLSSSHIDTFSYLIRYMDNHYSEDLTLEFLADFASMSKYHFSRTFREFTGLSPIDYLINLRIMHAKMMMPNTSVTLKEIAYATGFQNINNFIKQFRRIEGVTPSEYRKGTIHGAKKLPPSGGSS